MIWLDIDLVILAGLKKTIWTNWVNDFVEAWNMHCKMFRLQKLQSKVLGIRLPSVVRILFNN